MRPEQFVPEAHEAAIDRIVREYGNAILRLCLMYLRDLQAAEDAAQDSLIKIDRKLDSFRGECSEKTWIMRIVTNTCRDYYKLSWTRHVDRSVSLDELDPPQTGEDREPEEREMNRAVIRAVTRLKKPLREVILLRYYQEMKITDVARALGVSVATVNRRLRKAHEALKPELWEVYFDE